MFEQIFFMVKTKYLYTYQRSSLETRTPPNFILGFDPYLSGLNSSRFDERLPN